MKIVAAALLAVLCLAGCTTQPQPVTPEVQRALECLINAGVEATIENGAIVVTEYANDDPDAVDVPRSVIDACLPD